MARARRRPALLLALAVVLATSLFACSSAGSRPDFGSARRSDSSGTQIRQAADAATTGQPVRKLLVLVIENHSLAQMRAGMPFTYALARRFGYATDYFAIRHPSLPNYIAIAGGSTYGIADDAPPWAHRLMGRSVFGEAVANGKTAAVYEERMPTPCALKNDPAGYAARHNPWAYFVQERRACDRHDRPLASFRRTVADGRLPNAGMVIPDLCHDAHDCGLRVADQWIRKQVGAVLAGPDWRSGHLAVVITADEDDKKSANRVLTVVVHPSQRHHVVTTRLTHYSLSRLYSEVLAAPPLRQAASAPSMARAFALPVR
jgi:hypothetical protein